MWALPRGRTRSISDLGGSISIASSLRRRHVSCFTKHWSTYRVIPILNLVALESRRSTVSDALHWHAPRPVRNYGPTRGGRDGRGVPRDGHQPKAPGRDQSVATGRGDRSRATGSVPT